MKVFIITEGSEEIGFGHITRCISISQAFKTRGISTEFIVNGDETVTELLIGEVYTMLDWTREENRLVDTIKRADFAIVDSYITDARIYEKIANAVKIPVYIDDNNRIEYPPGIVVNGTRYAKDLNFPKKKGITYFIGKEYALFRKEFWDVEEKQVSRELSTILVFPGGADVRNLTSKILRLLAGEYPQINKRVIVSKGFKNADTLRGLGDRKTDFIPNPDAKKIREIMLSADIAVTTGGQTMYELCRVGVPMIAVAASENQIRSIEDLKKTGLIEYAGRWDDRELMENMKKYINKLDPYDIRLRKSSILREVFNGKSTLYLIDQLISKGAQNKISAD